MSLNAIKKKGEKQDMAFMTVSVSRKLTENERETLLKGLGEVQCKLPGKDAKSLAVIINEDVPMYVSGVKQDNMVYSNIKYTGKFKYQIRSDFTVALFDTIGNALGTPKERMLLEIDELQFFGGFGDLYDIYYS